MRMSMKTSLINLINFSGFFSHADGEALLVNLYRKVVLHHFNFKQRVYDIEYSPDGRYNG